MNGPPGQSQSQNHIDAELLGQLLDEHGPALALYAAQWTEAADDCVQEALVELARQPARPDNIVAWLYRVVKHRALNAARSTRRRRERESRAMAGRFAQTNQRAAFDRWDVLTVIEALEQLETEEREVVVMRIWGGLTYAAVAAALEISISAAHRRYSQALFHLRELLEATCPIKTNPNDTNCPPS
jgi:RNA polymerase sigma factor (sigma-70 family)